MKKHNISDLLLYVLSAELIGALSALLSGGFSDFFEVYKEPPLLPPAWLFPVVWTILYALMGISAYLLHIEPMDTEGRLSALTSYWVQLIINFSWSIVFFRFDLLWASVAVILALLAAVIVMIRRFLRIRPAAAYINIPYLIWLIFATYLNIATAVIN